MSLVNLDHLSLSSTLIDTLLKFLAPTLVYDYKSRALRKFTTTLQIERWDEDFVTELNKHSVNAL